MPAGEIDSLAEILQYAISTEASMSTPDDAVIHELLAAAEKAAHLGTAAGYAAMTGLLGEVARLRLGGPAETQDFVPAVRRPRLTDEEWLEKYAPKAPEE